MFGSMDPGSLLQHLGSAIRRRRKELGLSQEDLAERSGLHRNYIGGVERGERNVGFLNLVRLCEGLKVSLSELMTLVEETAAQ